MTIYDTVYEYFERSIGEVVETEIKYDNKKKEYVADNGDHWDNLDSELEDIDTGIPFWKDYRYYSFRLTEKQFKAIYGNKELVHWKESNKKWEQMA